MYFLQQGTSGGKTSATKLHPSQNTPDCNGKPTDTNASLTNKFYRSSQL